MLEEEILIQLATESEEHLCELIKKYDKTIKCKISKYKNYINDIGLDKNDLYQEALLGLINAVKTYNDSKEAKFNTYANLLIERKISDTVKSQYRNKNKILNESISLDDDFEINLYNKIKTNYSIPGENLELKELNIKIKELLTEEENKVYELKKENKTNKEISLILDKPIKSIENTLQRVKNKIKSVN